MNVCVHGTVSPVCRRAGSIWGSLSSLCGCSVPHKDAIPFLNSWGLVGTKWHGDDFCNVDRRACQRSPLSLLFFTPFCCKLGGWWQKIAHRS